MENKINSLKNRIESYKTSSNLLKSFKYAFSGISYVLKTSRNFKIQLIFAVTSLIIGFLLQISHSNYVILIATIMSVLILEILNTSIESIVDLVVKKEFSSLAKISKDTSAGAVLLASINSVIIALYIFVPKIKFLFESI
ncbi:diacylglycerol kinase family protein [Prochlorococcus marinus XMU1411]|uniref:diacylglycerol kinase family protein n=1 Tax=Prochlorococcus marinus TaxID=1219 RepID=UPI001ADA1467|nr:diacylglycerol kinase family protein [Prochlorococcus marinus]MBO8243058.1 diacylglycerol kinase family protein [Prochlorococcus marinus XMU1411]MBW3054177.1 diacylglycerol kinase [Prochlorococcus marinus str. MU1411]MCR8537749.1 diacylglycerol kinase family protein [Prochlorococcus marinus CUG1430]